MANITWDCPHPECRVKKVAFTTVLGHFGSEDKAAYVCAICPVCRRPTLFRIATTPPGRNPLQFFDPNSNSDAFGQAAREHLNRHGGISDYSVKMTWPAPQEIDVPSNTPANVASALAEGLQARAVNLINSAVYNLRKAVERAVKDRDPSGTGSLKARIKALAAKQSLPTTLVDLFHTVRAEGNTEVHEDEVWTAEQVDELIEFTRLLLVYLYTLPAQISAIAAHRGAAPGDR